MVHIFLYFSVDCLYTPTSHLHHTFDACVIQPGQSVDVPFTFYPREPIKYKETVTFEINGLSKQNIEISGQGTEMKVSTKHLTESKSLAVNDTYVVQKLPDFVATECLKSCSMHMQRAQIKLPVHTV